MSVDTERRGWRRFKRDEPLVFLMEGKRVDATLKNISLGGAFLSSTQVPELGRYVEFSLRCKSPRIPMTLATGQVIRHFTDENVDTEKWGFGLKWTSLRSSGGPAAVRSLFDEISGEFPAVKWLNSLPESRASVTGGKGPNGAVAVWIRAVITYMDLESECIVTSLGAQRIEVRTPGVHMSPEATVTVMMDGDGGKFVRILGRVMTTFHNDDGGRSEIKVIYREDVSTDN